MKAKSFAGAAMALLAGAALGADEKMPEMPPPQAEHQWLMQMVGEWTSEVTMSMAPDQGPTKSQGEESVRAVGGFWTLAENTGRFMEKPFKGILTLGYDFEKKQYVGTWIDSMTSHLWTYTGTLDEAKKVLILLAEGPCPGKPGQIIKFRERVEILNKDHRTFTSSMQNDDGSWVTNLTIDYRRKGLVSGGTP